MGKQKREFESEKNVSTLFGRPAFWCTCWTYQTLTAAPATADALAQGGIPSVDLSLPGGAWGRQRSGGASEAGRDSIGRVFRFREDVVSLAELQSF